jgi:hypothetical protein
VDRVILPGGIVQFSSNQRLLIALSVAVEMVGGLRLSGFFFLTRDGNLIDRLNHMLSPNTVAGRYRELFSVQKESG